MMWKMSWHFVTKGKQMKNWCNYKRWCRWGVGNPILRANRERIATIIRGCRISLQRAKTGRIYAIIRDGVEEALVFSYKC